MKVVELGVGNIPAQLRGLAQAIEDGRVKSPDSIALVAENEDDFEVYGFGRTGDSVRTVGVLQAGILFLMREKD